MTCPAFRLKISDGDTVLDMYEGADVLARVGGLDIALPEVRASFIPSSFSNGSRLSRSQYGNRIITIRTQILGYTLEGLRDKIRDIQRILTDATNRTVTGFGNRYYLEVQYGDTDDESTFFDILRADLILPANFWDMTFRRLSTIVNATIRLVCEPFGRYTNQDEDQDTLENAQSDYDVQVSYLAGDNADFEIHGTNWAAQTFTTVGAFTAVAAAIKCYREGVIGDMVYELYATAAGAPVGAAIAQGTVDASLVNTNATHPNYHGYLRAIFDTPVALGAATVYALIVYKAGGTIANNLHWCFDNGGGYAGGQRFSSVNSGVVWTPQVGDDHLFAIFAAEDFENFQDITMSQAKGDLPAKVFHMIEQAGAAGSKKIWVAKRSGDRQEDDLWFEGEEAEYTNIIGGAPTDHEFFRDVAVILSGEMDFTSLYVDAVAADTDVGSFDIVVTTVPRGAYRVLARVKTNFVGTPADYDHYAFGVGWTYGDATKAPTEADSEFYRPDAGNNTWQTLDLGEITLPPLPESEIASNNEITLRIYVHAIEATPGGNTNLAQLDWIMLLPIDEGVVIVPDVAAADVVCVDTISDPASVFFTDNAVPPVIEATPDYVGAPFDIGREDTRIYIHRDDVKAVSLTSDLKLQPQFMMI